MTDLEKGIRDEIIALNMELSEKWHLLSGNAYNAIKMRIQYLEGKAEGVRECLRDCKN